MIPLKILFLAVFLLAASGIHSADQTDQNPDRALGPNLLTNGGFEGGLHGWDTFNMHVVESSESAHSGEACCNGFVPKKSLFGRVRRTLSLELGAEYQVSFWARSDAGSGVTVWGDRDGGRYERRILRVRDIPEEWTEYRATFRARNAWTVLDFHVPDGFVSPEAGTVWIDDISVRRTGSPLEGPPAPWAEETLEPGEVAFDPDGGYDDQPSLARDTAGTIYLSYLRSLGKHHAIVLRFFDGKKWSERVDLTTTAARRFPPAITAAKRGVWIAWAEEDPNGSWRVAARHFGPGKTGRTVRVAEGSGNNSDVAVAVDREGDPWFAYQTTRNKRYDVAIKKYHVKSGRWVNEAVLSNHTGNGQCPAIALDHRGTVWAAWSAYAGGAFQLWVQAVGGTGGVGTPRRLDLWDQDNTHATFTAGADRLWLAWNTSSRLPGEFDYGGTWEKGVAVACTDGEQWFLPPGWEAADGPRGRIAPDENDVERGNRTGVEMPRIMCTRSGAPLLLCRRYVMSGALEPGRYGNVGHWDTLAFLLAADGWRPVEMPFTHGGRPERIGAAAGDAGAIWLAQQEDNRLAGGGYFQYFDGDSWVAVRKLTDLAEAGNWRSALQPTAELAKEEAVPPTAQRPHHTITHDGQTYTLYWGDLHIHTDRSLCGRNWNGYADDNLKYCYYGGGRDFAALTDHGKHMNDHDWYAEVAITSANNIPGTFVTLAGVEWTSQMVGHKNIIFRDLDVPLFDALHQPVLDMWRLLSPGQAISIPHHPSDTTHTADWDYHDPRFQMVGEIYQERGSYEYSGAPGHNPRMSAEGTFFRDALQRGYRLGFIASPDHHGTYGAAAVYTTELTREAIFEALLARRCYGAVKPTAFLDVRVDGHLMGEVIAAEPRKGPHRVTVHVETDAPIESLTVIRNGEVLHEFDVSGSQADVEFVDEHPEQAPTIGDPPEQTVYYYVRVVQEHVPGRHRQHIAWSSPVWITLDPEPHGLSSYKTWTPPSDTQE